VKKKRHLIRRRRSLWHMWPAIPLTLGCYYWIWRAEHLTVTNRYVSLKSGVFSKKERRVHLKHILDVVVEQGFIERIFHYGTITIETAASGGKEIVLTRLNQPDKVRDVLFEAIEALEETT